MKYYFLCIHQSVKGYLPSKRRSQHAYTVLHRLRYRIQRFVKRPDQFWHFTQNKNYLVIRTCSKP